MVEAAVNDNPDVPGFIQRFSPPFPVGTAPGQAALDYMQWPKDDRPLVPLMVFIDRKGMIRAQYSGADSKFFDGQQYAHIRDVAEGLLSESAAPAKKKTTHAAK